MPGVVLPENNYAQKKSQGNDREDEGKNSRSSITCAGVQKSFIVIGVCFHSKFFNPS